MNYVWLLYLRRVDTRWHDLQAIYTDEAAAIAACTEPEHCYCRVELNKPPPQQVVPIYPAEPSERADYGN